MPNSCWITRPSSPAGASPSASSSRIRRRTGSPRMSSACMCRLLRRNLYKSRLIQVERAGEGAHLIREEFGLFHGGEVPPAPRLAPVPDVREAPLGPATRRPWHLGREDRGTG